MNDAQYGIQTYFLPQLNPSYLGKCVFWLEAQLVKMRVEFGPSSATCNLPVDDLNEFLNDFEWYMWQSDGVTLKKRVAKPAIYHESGQVDVVLELTLAKGVGQMQSAVMWINGKRFAEIVSGFVKK